eukprot:GHVN01057518.1.p1 GENE.GHVN01057518.1~~GHVN01057518.1.p1  ORF type:complete len:317 (+),score=38.62 GHVN01057518.1:2855-3805(+)
MDEPPPSPQMRITRSRSRRSVGPAAITSNPNGSNRSPGALDVEQNTVSYGKGSTTIQKLNVKKYLQPPDTVVLRGGKTKNMVRRVGESSINKNEAKKTRSIARQQNSRAPGSSASITSAECTRTTDPNNPNEELSGSVGQPHQPSKDRTKRESSQTSDSGSKSENSNKDACGFGDGTTELKRHAGAQRETIWDPFPQGTTFRRSDSEESCFHILKMGRRVKRYDPDMVLMFGPKRTLEDIVGGVVVVPSMFDLTEDQEIHSTDKQSLNYMSKFPFEYRDDMIDPLLEDDLTKHMDSCMLLKKYTHVEIPSDWMAFC